MKVAVENLQRALQLLGLHDRERRDAPEDVWVLSARTYILDACTMLERQDAGAEVRTSVIELLLKAELALASVPSSNADLSFRLADQLLLEARVRLGAAEGDEST